MYLIFDTSANGPGPKKNISPDNTFHWPRLIHLSWIMLNEDLKPIEDYNCFIKPEGFQITSEIEKKASLESEKLKEKGDDLKEVLEAFSESIGKSEYVFAHNLAFNEGVVVSECIRKSIKNPFTLSENYCLMHEGTYFCRIPSRSGGYKWPSLNELHAALFNQKYSPAHNARADVIAASRCFIKLKMKGALEEIFD